MRLLRPTVREHVFEAYWRFASDRQRIFERRVAGLDPPWTDDRILARYRFCNAFRASDRITQGLIRAAYSGSGRAADDVFLRVALFRIFSRADTWELIESELGGVSAGNFDRARASAALDKARARGQSIYTAAFILSSPSGYGFQRKHANHLALIEDMLDSGLPTRIAAAGSLEEVYNLLAGWPSIGPFMAYQLAIDLNYTELIDFDEDEFTVPGPGAMRGLRKVFSDPGGMGPAEAVHWLVAYQDRVGGDLGIQPPTLFGRRLRAIDCQNLLCEVDKYCRVAFPRLGDERTRIKQTFAPSSARLDLWYPPKWGVEAPCH